MPVILDPDGYDLWLDPGMRDVGAAPELLKPYDARLMRSYPVSTRINRVANDDAECSKPVELAQIQDRFFVGDCGATQSFQYMCHGGCRRDRGSSFRILAARRAARQVPIGNV
jgi:hypothetical protein